MMDITLFSRLTRLFRKKPMAVYDFPPSPWWPSTLPLDPAAFDEIVAKHPGLCGIPVYHRGEDTSRTWPTPASIGGQVVRVTITDTRKAGEDYHSP